MSIYADSSFFVSIYLVDTHTSEALRRLSPHPRVWFTPFHRAEIASAVGQQVYRRHISQERAARTHERVARHLARSVWVAAEFPPPAFDRATELAQTHAALLGTRTLDTLHVAAAIELGATEFWTFDERQARLAKATGLKVS